MHVYYPKKTHALKSKIMVGNGRVGLSAATEKSVDHSHKTWPLRVRPMIGDNTRLYANVASFTAE